MRALKMAFLLVAATLMTGCFQIDVVHRLQPYGMSDTGAYRISMNNFTYGMIQGDGSYAKLVSQLRRFSRQTLRIDDNGAHLEDLTSVASMERMYDTYNCDNAPVADYVDCRFVSSIDFKETPGFVVGHKKRDRSLP